MKKILVNTFLSVIFILMLAVGASPVSAQDPAPTPLPVNTVNLVSPNDFLLAQVSQNDIELIGPYDSTTYSFGIPANWMLTDGASLVLNLGVSFSSVANQTVDATGADVLGGTLTVRFNGVIVSVLPLTKVGEMSEPIVIPVSALISQRSDGRMELGFTLDGGISCFANNQMTVSVHTNSRFSLPHVDVSPSTSLINFPRPLYQNSVMTDSALVVIPNEPSSAELQAALTVAAGLGSLTGNAFLLDMTTVGNLTPELRGANNLILVGKASTLPLLNELKIPFPADGGQFKFDSGAEDNGVVQMIISPWIEGKVVMLVSANTDAGVVKAAQAVSTGVLRPNTSPNLAIVEKVEPEQLVAAVRVDQTLADLALAENKTVPTLGKAIKTLRFGGAATATYRFFIPAGQTVSPDAYFDLVFGHSTLLNYARSGLLVSINGQPISTVRMTDQTGAQSTNHAKFTIPATVIVPGYNRIEIRANLIPNDACVNPQFDGLWTTIWPESMLHIPLMTNQVASTSIVDLSAYPVPYTLQPTLSTTAFVLPHKDPESWRSAFRIARFLGNRTQGAFFTLSSFYADELKDTDRVNNNLLLIGRATQLSIIDEINANLPAPFNAGSDMASENSLQVQYNIPATASVGYVQLLASPWNPNNIVIAALGSNPTGANWAASALVDAPLRSLLAGNFAVINEAQVVTTDTRQLPFSIAADGIQGVGANISQVKPDLSSPVTGRPTWIMPTILVGLILVVIVLLVSVLGAFAQRRRNKYS